jgi:drug/metabolite transporter (DMT)-like permease
MQLTDRTVAYAAFGMFCVLSSCRDIVSEYFFKHDLYDASPIFVLFTYSVVTQFVATLVLCGTGITFFRTVALLSDLRNELLWLNFFTLMAFLFYFFAIKSPMGAGVNAFVDYGSGPIFTAFVGAFLLKQRLDIRFALCSSISVGGIALLSMPRLLSSDISLFWALGLLLALLSSLCSAFYRVYSKIALDKGMTIATIVLLRLSLVTLVLGGILIVQPDLFRLDLLLPTAIVGVVGFCLPLFLILTVIQRVTIPNFAMLLFLLPALTLSFSVGLGYTQFYVSDAVAAGLILLGVALYLR